ncbi:hypothetical protein M0R45_002234 [Rubus argutus]|uniref:Uncharacterized protein n=1 Tax=Rubus argutus TaxID=59490 RepID=A0AAW1VCK4_RUBAR
MRGPRWLQRTSSGSGLKEDGRRLDRSAVGIDAGSSSTVMAEDRGDIDEESPRLGLEQKRRQRDETSTGSGQRASTTVRRVEHGSRRRQRSWRRRLGDSGGKRWVSANLAMVWCAGTEMKTMRFGMGDGLNVELNDYDDELLCNWTEAPIGLGLELNCHEMQ